jgi:hypothetical protein
MERLFPSGGSGPGSNEDPGRERGRRTNDDLTTTDTDIAVPPSTSTAGTSTSAKPLKPATRRPAHGERDGDAAENDDGKATSSNSSNAGTAAASSRIRRRNRMITSCLECRRRKLKCDRSHPCTNCAKFKRDCIFLAPALDSKSKMKLTELKEKMGSLERFLEVDVAGKGEGGSEGSHDSSAAAGGGAVGAGEEAIGRDRYGVGVDAPIPEDEADLEPTQMAVQDAAYEGEADDDAYDLGFKLGKMRLTDRVGGLFRPKISDEVRSNLPVLCIWKYIGLIITSQSTLLTVCIIAYTSAQRPIYQGEAVR